MLHKSLQYIHASSLPLYISPVPLDITQSTLWNSTDRFYPFVTLSMSPESLDKILISTQNVLTALLNCPEAKFRNILSFADFWSYLLHQNCFAIHNIKSRRSFFPTVLTSSCYYDVTKISITRNNRHDWITFCWVILFRTSQ